MFQVLTLLLALNLVNQCDDACYILPDIFFLYIFILCPSMCRAKKDLDANLAVAHTWSEFNSMLDKQKVCSR